MIHWKELAANSSFRNLFSEGGENPLRKKIDQLELKIRDVNIVDPIQMVKFKAELAGIRCVEEIVLRAAEQISASGSVSTSPAANRLVSVAEAMDFAGFAGNLISSIPPTAPQESSTSRLPRPEKTLLQRMFGGRIGT